MKRFRTFALILATAAVAAAGCNVQHSSSSAIQVLQPSAVIPSLLGSWTSQSITALPGAPATCGTFQWTVTTQTETDIAGTFSATCAGGVTITGTASGHIDGTSVPITVSGSATLAGVPSCAFSLSGNGVIDGDTIRVPYTGTTCLGPVSGTENLRRSYIQPPAPTPAPVQTPAPTPVPPPSGGPDQINMSAAHIVNSPGDLASWPVTTTLSRVDIGQGGVHVEFSKQSGAGRWPDVTPPGWSGTLQYTLGMCLNINSTWNCSAVVEFWYGLDEGGGPPSGYANNWFYDPARWAPMTGHQPAPGETIGFFVCAGDCRNNKLGDLSPVKERSNVVLLPMPGNGGGAFTFRK